MICVSHSPLSSLHLRHPLLSALGNLWPPWLALSDCLFPQCSVLGRLCPWRKSGSWESRRRKGRDETSRKNWFGFLCDSELEERLRDSLHILAPGKDEMVCLHTHPLPGEVRTFGVKGTVSSCPLHTGTTATHAVQGSASWRRQDGNTDVSRWNVPVTHFQLYIRLKVLLTVL